MAGTEDLSGRASKLIRLAGACTSLLASAGCGLFGTSGDGSGGGASAAPVDPFVAAIADAEAAEKPYIEGARPVITALVNRDYAGLYDLMSNHALRKVDKAQFLAPMEENPPAEPPLENLTKEQFVEWMQQVESRYGPPMDIDYISVETVDPEVLAGRGDAFEVMMSIGGMPASIPVEIRRAAILSRINCQFSDEAIKTIAAELGISEEQTRSGKWPENTKGYDWDERPYFKIRFVLVEDDKLLKVGYFECVPPSILD